VSNSIQVSATAGVLSHFINSDGAEIYTLSAALSTRGYGLFVLAFSSWSKNYHSRHGLRKLYVAMVNYTAQILCFKCLVWFVLTFLTEEPKIEFERTIK